VLDDQVYLIQRKGLNVHPLQLQWLDVLVRIIEIKTLRGLRQDHSQNGHVAVDRFGCHRRFTGFPSSITQRCSSGENVSLGDLADPLILKGRLK
jgi:hypothetical protein